MSDTRPRTVTIEEIRLFGAISAFMSKLYDRTHTEERTLISQFICEATAKECVEHIRTLTSEEKRLIDGELLTLTELQGKLSGCPTKHILAKWAQAE